MVIRDQYGNLLTPLFHIQTAGCRRGVAGISGSLLAGPRNRNQSVNPRSLPRPAAHGQFPANDFGPLTHGFEAQAISRNRIQSLSVILYAEPDVPRIVRKINSYPPRVRVPQDICQRFLSDAQQVILFFGRQSASRAVENKLCLNRSPCGQVRSKASEGRRQITVFQGLKTQRQG